MDRRIPDARLCVIKTEDSLQVHFALEARGIVANIAYMKRILFLALLVVALAPGCGKKPDSSGSTPEGAKPTAANDAPAAKAPEAPPSSSMPAPIPAPMSTAAGSSNAPVPVDAGQLTRELRRYVVANRRIPKTFEEFVSLSKIQVPAPPAGKKYAIVPGSKVVLVDR
jgi:hypothetical protein